jgi:putative endonuclease
MTIVACHAEWNEASLRALPTRDIASQTRAILFLSVGVKRSMKQYYVYIMSSKSGTLYTGMTNNLARRVYEHKHKLTPGFTQKYNVNRLVYYEVFNQVRDAIAREKAIKGWLRQKKIALIESFNPTWSDLSEEWE